MLLEELLTPLVTYWRRKCEHPQMFLSIYGNLHDDRAVKTNIKLCDLYQHLRMKKACLGGRSFSYRGLL